MDAVAEKEFRPNRRNIGVPQILEFDPIELSEQEVGILTGSVRTFAVIHESDESSQMSEAYWARRGNQHALEPIRGRRYGRDLELGLVAV